MTARVIAEGDEELGSLNVETTFMSGTKDVVDRLYLDGLGI